jgi:hypothetical protein
VTEGSGADPVPKPWVLDVSVLVAIARADAEVTNLVITLDGRGQPLIIPVLAVAAASGDTRTEDGDIALRGLERLENSLVAPNAQLSAWTSLYLATPSCEMPPTGWRLCCRRRALRRATGWPSCCQRARLPSRLLWRAGRRGHRRADEPAAQEP